MTPAARPACLVMDVDWAHDEVIDFALATLTRLGVPATVYVTHDSPALARLRASPLIDLGIHPNFNDLLQGTAPAGASARSRIRDLMALVPEARSVRSHSLVHTSWLVYEFADAGLTHEVNTYTPPRAGVPCKAWRNWDGRIIRVPFCFEDSLQPYMPGAWDHGELARLGGLRVLNFHPIRLFLNAAEPVLPAGVRAAASDPAALAAWRRPESAMGSLTFLERFVAAERAAGRGFARVADIVPEEDA